MQWCVCLSDLDPDRTSPQSCVFSRSLSNHQTYQPNLKIVQLLIQHNAKLDRPLPRRRRNGEFAFPDDFKNPLTEAAANGRADIVACLLEARASLDRAFNARGASALHVAKNTSTMLVLLEARADVDCLDPSGATPCVISAIATVIAANG